MKKRLLVCITIMLMLSSACESVEKTSTQRTSNTSNNSVENATVSPGVDTSQINIYSVPKPETDNSIIPNNTSEPFIGRMNFDSETEKSFYGTWKVEKLLGFANSYNDASEYPTGQKFIGYEIIIEKNFFSSKGLKNYNVYQYELKNPLYEITAICYNSDSFYRLFKIKFPGLNINDEVKYIDISDSYTKISIPVSVSFFIVNNDRLILLSEATCFELKKVTD
jgi:hypothetical protein